MSDGFDRIDMGLVDAFDNIDLDELSDGDLVEMRIYLFTQIKKVREEYWGRRGYQWEEIDA